jgi:ABC-type molybdate transport system substrate-binding protein
MKKKIVISIFIILLAIIFISKSIRYEIGKNLNIFSAGSYAYSETYQFNTSEATLIKAIETFKKNNSKYLVPKVTINHQGQHELKDKIMENGNFSCYFFDPQKNRIYKTSVYGDEFKSIGKMLIKTFLILKMKSLKRSLKKSF